MKIENRKLVITKQEKEDIFIVIFLLGGILILLGEINLFTKHLEGYDFGVFETILPLIIASGAIYLFFWVCGIILVSYALLEVVLSLFIVVEDYKKKEIIAENKEQ